MFGAAIKPNVASVHQFITASYHLTKLKIVAKATMRTTLDIDDDLLAATKEMARNEGATAGQIVSRLLRNSLTGAEQAAREPARRRPAVAGFRAFPARPGVVVTNDQVNALRDAEGI